MTAKKQPTSGWQPKPYHSAVWEGALVGLVTWLFILACNLGLRAWGSAQGYPITWISHLSIGVAVAFVLYFAVKMYRNRELHMPTIKGAPAGQKVDN